MRILFLGTGPFAVPALQAIEQSEYELLGLVTRPAPASLRRKQKVPPNPMRDAAESLGLTVWDPADVNDSAGLEILRRVAAELLVVCDYGQILSPQALATAKLGGINLHGSLLPKYRGAAPVHWAIYHGEAVTGISVIHMTPRLDGGPILVQREVEIGDEETMPELEERLARLGATAVLDALPKLETWDGESPLGELQAADQVTKAPRLRKDQGRVDWTGSAAQIRNQIRAFQPWPGTFTWLHQPDHPPLRLLLAKASVCASETGCPTPTTPAGAIRVNEQGELRVATGDGWLRLDEVQPAGKRRMNAAEFLRGHPLGQDCRLADESPNGPAD